MGNFLTTPSTDIIGGEDVVMGSAAAVVLIVALIFFAIGLLVTLAYYLIYSFGLYRVAKKLDVKYAFVAWIPLAQYYTLGKVAEKCDERHGKIARPWGLYVLIGSVGASLLGGALGAIASIASIIPLLGMIIYMICYLAIMLLSFAPLVLDCICRWKIYREFFPETVNIVLFIVGIVLNAHYIITLVAAFRKPNDVESEYIENVEYSYND